MLIFKKLILIRDNKFFVEYDSNTTVADVIQRSSSVNNKNILVVEGSGNIYHVELEKIMRSETIPSSNTLGELVSSFLTPEMIYENQTELKLNDMFYSFNYADIPGDLKAEVFSIVADEVTTLRDDPTHSDLRLSSDTYDLEKVIPIVDGKLRKSIWKNKKLYIENGVELLNDLASLHFISVANVVDIQEIGLTDIGVDWTIPDGYVPALVLDGKMYIDETYVFHIDTRNKLVINSSFVMSSGDFDHFDDFPSLLASPESFLIMLKGDRLLIRDVVSVKEKLGVVQVLSDVSRDHLSFVCFDDSNKVQEFSLIDEQYTGDELMNDSRDTISHAFFGVSTDNVKMRQIILT